MSSPSLRILVALAWLAGCANEPPPEPPRPQPNFLLVLADDLGFSDIGPFGGEVRTPTLDRLAANGVIATNFYVAPDGVPTAAMLLTGVDHHLSGLGGLPGRMPKKYVGLPGYEGRLSRNAVTIASLLQDAGYHTYMAGKWDLGRRENRPEARGFEQSFVLLEPGASHWADMRSARRNVERAVYTHNGEVVESLPEAWYSTRGFTDKLLEFIEADHGDGKPFFAFLSYQAPHSPLSAERACLEENVGRYDRGFQAIGQRRLTTQKRLKIMRQEVVSFPGLPTVPAWADLAEEDRKEQARRMEIYSSMVQCMDANLGRLLARLEEMGERRHTTVMFLSDNGASATDRGPHGHDPGWDWLDETFPEHDFESWGSPGSFVELGAGWGQVSATPFRMFKGTVAEGGIRSPLVASGAGVDERGVDEALLHVMDVPATILELAGVEHPERFQGRKVIPIEGFSASRIISAPPRPLTGRRLSRRLRLAQDIRTKDQALGFEFHGGRALRQGVWKAVLIPHPIGTGKWRLYRLDLDPSELYDVGPREPEKLQELIQLWKEWASTHNVPFEE